MTEPLGTSSNPNYRALLAVATVVVSLASLTAAKRVVVDEAASTSRGGSTSSRADGLLADGTNPADPTADPLSGPGSGRGSVAGGAVSATETGRRVDGPQVPGINASNEIVLTYYWKGDRTMTSPYLKGSGHDGNVDEGKAFMGLVKYINSHDNDGTRFMGHPIKLHGRKIRGVVLEAGQYPDSYAFTAEKIAKEVKPFAAIAAHGSISSYICPRLAQAGIFNLSTYDLGGSLSQRTNGYCVPSGLPWERQVQASTSYLTWHAANTKYNNTEPRVYGVIYVEYPGLVDSAPKMVERLRAAGLNVPPRAVRSLASDLATSQQQAPGVVARMREEGVNTIIMPDAGAPMNFTHAAQTNGFSPDYFVWPCSGQDTTAMVRLYNAVQWARASGLTCYDAEFTPDLTNDDAARNAEWYKAYVEATGDRDVPSAASLVYAALAQAVFGISNAGPNLTPDTFKAGLGAMQPYRYSATRGRTDNQSSLLLEMGSPDRAFIGDVTRIQWSASARNPGSAAPGAYQFPDPRRYSADTRF
ncbi:MAG TPA: ABC transporter substrate-binding protein [Actinomycetota bacterium]|nr:ABC transporter substrate-binding protein [Actinomycetota bacterium]